MYEDAIAKVPGVEVLDIQYFGYYQGSFICKIKVNEEIKYIYADYGSCCGCDSYEAEFAFSDPSDEQLASFGESYLSLAQSKEALLDQLKNNIYGEGEESEEYKWLINK